MSALNRTRVAWPAVALLAFTAPIAAAPAPEPVPASPLEKYFPDDSNGIVLINVKQILASPAYTKMYQKQVEGLLAMDQVQPWLKDCGFNPLKDIDLAAVIMSPSAQPMNSPGSGGPFIIFQGRFDPVKFQAKADQIVKDGMGGGIFKSSKAGDTTIYEVGFPHGPTFFACLLDKTTLVAAPVKDLAVEALDKAAGKKTTKLKNEALKKKLDKMDPKNSVTMVGMGDMVIGGHSSVTIQCGVQRVESHSDTLADNGIETAEAAIVVSDDIKGKVTLTTKDAEKAKELAKTMETGIERAIDEGTKQNIPEVTTMVEALKSIKTSTKEEKILMEGKANPGVIQSFFSYVLMGRSAPATRVAPPCPQ
ncbi:MAG: hypothetical protein ACJ8FY_21250 [Gemmataceae bacterium]